MWQKCADCIPPFTFHCDALGRDETDKVLLRYRGTYNNAAVVLFYRYPGEDDIKCQGYVGISKETLDNFEWCAIPE